MHCSRLIVSLAAVALPTLVLAQYDSNGSLVAVDADGLLPSNTGGPNQQSLNYENTVNDQPIDATNEYDGFVFTTTSTLYNVHYETTFVVEEKEEPLLTTSRNGRTCAAIEITPTSTAETTSKTSSTTTSSSVVSSSTTTVSSSSTTSTTSSTTSKTSALPSPTSAKAKADMPTTSSEVQSTTSSSSSSSSSSSKKGNNGCVGIYNGNCMPYM